MTKFLRTARRVDTVSYSRTFDFVTLPGAGFGFDCDEKGDLLRDSAGAPVDNFGRPLNATALANLAACLTGNVAGHTVIDRGVQPSRGSYIEPAAIACVRCGREIELTRDAVACVCGQYYNLSGQALSNPSNWGEETGETASDILRGGDPFDGD